MTLIAETQRKVKDTSSRLTAPDDFAAAVSAALARYSRHNPKKAVDDLTGDGSHDLDLPDDWETDFSTIISVEYPVDEVPAELVDDRDWSLYLSPDGLVLRLSQNEPAADESVRLTYTVSRLEADVPSGDQDAVACLAASFCCELLASIFGYSGDSTIAADSVDHKSRGAVFAARAKRMAALYYQHMGVDPDASAPGAMTMAPAPDAENIRLTHLRTS
jgi:hypothetical protein